MAVPSYDYQPPYAMPTLPKMGDPSSYGMGGDGSYTPPYIGGHGDPNAGRMGGGSQGIVAMPPLPPGYNGPVIQTSDGPIPAPGGGPNTVPSGGQMPQSPAGGYGPYLGWDQQKLNDASHNTPKYQFLRAMLDAGISSQNRDLGGAVSALQARGYPVSAVPGSSDQIKWGDQGTYDIFNGTNGDFFFGEQNAGGAPMATSLGPGMAGAAPGSLMQPMGGGTPDLGLGPWNSSSYSNPNSQQIANQSPGMFNRQPYTPPYLNGAA